MPGFRLTQDEAWEAIAAAHTSMYTTLRKDGRPITLPVWHVVIDRAIYIKTPARAAKLVRIRNDPRGYFLVEFGRAWTELVAVSAEVTGSIVNDAGVEEAVLAALKRKYAGLEAPLEQLPPQVQATYAHSAVVRLDPVGRIGSWNNRALLGDQSSPFPPRLDSNDD